MSETTTIPKKRAVITTSWDDGHLEDQRLADLLETYRLPATFYIPRVDRLLDKPVLSPTQLRGLADRGFEIAAHTIEHTVLTKVNDHAARQTIRDSRHYIADATGRPCTMFCPPQGKFTAGHVEMIREAGYDGFRTVEMWSADTPRSRGRGLVEMPTTIQAQPQSTPSIARNLLKRRAARNAMLYLKHGRGDWATQAAALLAHVLEYGGVFHLWGHSWELDVFDQWARLERVFALLRDTADRAAMATNAKVCACAE